MVKETCVQVVHMLSCVQLCVYLGRFGGADGIMVGKVPSGHLGTWQLAQVAAGEGGARLEACGTGYLFGMVSYS